MTGPLPAARHLVALNRVRADAGGQTTAALQRTRLFAEEAGTGTTVLTFDAFPAYAEAEASLRERGVLHPDVRLRNVYDDLRERAWPEPTGATEELADLGDLRRVDEHRADGSLWRVRWDNPVNLEPLFHDYVRDDGSVSVRAAAPLSLDEFPRRPGLVQVVDPAGRVRESHETQGAFFASWVHHLVADDETVVLFHDSMMVPPHLTPELDERVRQVAVLHVAHVYAPRHWNSPAHPPAARTLAHLDRLDALVTLTERQRADIALGHGDRTNLFVRPNPAEPTEVPDPRPARDPKRFSVIARMERVKRVDDAVRAFAQVVEQEPDAVLDVYGDGSLRPRLEDLVRELGVDGSVVLHGHRPDAPQRLWESSGLLLTSRSEGFPLAPLEAAVRECPVVAYDIKYGPREQVEDGGTGYLVPAGDVAALARRVVDLARSPADVARMGARARERVLADRDAYVASWGRILERAEANRARRVHLDEVAFTPEQVPRPTAVWSRVAGRVPHRGAHVEVRGRLLVRGSGPDGWRDAVRVALDAVDQDTGTIVPVPITVRPADADAVTVHGRTGLRALLAEVPGPRPRLSLRLSVTAGNAYWETPVARPAGLEPLREIGYDADGTLQVRARR